MAVDVKALAVLVFDPGATDALAASCYEKLRVFFLGVLGGQEDHGAADARRVGSLVQDHLLALAVDDKDYASGVLGIAAVEFDEERSGIAVAGGGPLVGGPARRFGEGFHEALLPVGDKADVVGAFLGHEERAVGHGGYCRAVRRALYVPAFLPFAGLGVIERQSRFGVAVGVGVHKVVAQRSDEAAFVRGERRHVVPSAAGHVFKGLPGAAGAAEEGAHLHVAFGEVVVLAVGAGFRADESVAPSVVSVRNVVHLPFVFGVDGKRLRNRGGRPAVAVLDLDLHAGSFIGAFRQEPAVGARELEGEVVADRFERPGRSVFAEGDLNAPQADFGLSGGPNDLRFVALDLFRHGDFDFQRLRFRFGQDFRRNFQFAKPQRRVGRVAAAADEEPVAFHLFGVFLVRRDDPGLVGRPFLGFRKFSVGFAGVLLAEAVALGDVFFPDAAVQGPFGALGAEDHRGGAGGRVDLEGEPAPGIDFLYKRFSRSHGISGGVKVQEDGQPVHKVAAVDAVALRRVVEEPLLLVGVHAAAPVTRVHGNGRILQHIGIPEPAGSVGVDDGVFAPEIIPRRVRSVVHIAHLAEVGVGVGALPGEERPLVALGIVVPVRAVAVVSGDKRFESVAEVLHRRVLAFRGRVDRHEAVLYWRVASPAVAPGGALALHQRFPAARSEGEDDLDEKVDFLIFDLFPDVGHVVGQAVLLVLVADAELFPRHGRLEDFLNGGTVSRFVSVRHVLHDLEKVRPVDHFKIDHAAGALAPPVHDVVYGVGRVAPAHLFRENAAVGVLDGVGDDRVVNDDRGLQSDAARGVGSRLGLKIKTRGRGQKAQEKERLSHKGSLRFKRLSQCNTCLDSTIFAIAAQGRNFSC